MAYPTPKFGFTLVEILVATTVILSLTGLVVANFGNFSNNQKLKQSGKTLKNDLRFVQSRAQSALKPSTGCLRLASYRVTFTQTTYSHQAVCESGLAGSPTTITLPNGLVFSPVPAAIEFKVLSGIPDRTLQLVLSAMGRTYGVQIDQNGDLRDQGFLQ